MKRTPLYGEHLRLGAKLVPFGGYLMPVQYPSGIRAEHQAVRERAGMFDVSHMGEFRVRGPGALSFISHLTTNDPARLEGGQAQYTVMCLPDGGIVDDLLVYRFEEDDFRLVVNAANIAKDWRHAVSHAPDFDVELEDESEEVALIAVQGPRAEEWLAPLSSVELAEIGFYRFAPGKVAGVPTLVSRTGYTGEDGFELYAASADAAALWRRLEEKCGKDEGHGGGSEEERGGPDAGLSAAGLGARDTLRLEMGYALYGNDIDERTSPLEAGLGWLVKLEKGDFIGREALQDQKEGGLTRRLTGFRLTERGFPRPGYTVRFRGEEVGVVRSGTVSPSLGYGIGTVYLPPDAEPGEPVAVVIRDREVEGEIARPPFYREGSLER